jgi:hypothetical protein
MIRRRPVYLLNAKHSVGNILIFIARLRQEHVHGEVLRSVMELDDAKLECTGFGDVSGILPACTLKQRDQKHVRLAYVWYRARDIALNI